MNKAKIAIVAVAIGAFLGMTVGTFAQVVPTCGDITASPFIPCGNGPVVPIPLGWFQFFKGTNPVATEFNCPSWYGPMGCMAPNGTHITK